MMDIDGLIRDARTDYDRAQHAFWYETEVHKIASAHIPALLAALTSARALLAQSETLARAVDDPKTWRVSDVPIDYCRYCEYVTYRDGTCNHTDACPVTLARALLATEGEGR